MKKYDVFAIGNALMDFLVEIGHDKFLEFGLKHGDMCLVNKKRAKGLLERLDHHDFKVSPGGSSANTVAGVALLGGRAVFCGMVGNDANGIIYEKKLVEAGVKSAIAKTKRAMTGHAITFVTPDSQRTFAVHLGATFELAREHVLEEDIKASKVLHIEGYQLGDKKLRETSLHAIGIAKKHRTLVSVDLNSADVIRENLKFFIDIVKNSVDILFVNDAEAEAFTGKHDSEEALSAISGLGVKIIAVKLGENGSIIKKGNKVYRIAPVKANAIDSTGAGDMYAASILYGITNGLTIEQAGKLASYASAKVVEQLGARLEEKIDVKKVIGLKSRD